MKLNKTKKLLTILVCGCLMFGLSTTAFAYTDENTSETETSSEPVIERSDTVSSGETETNPFTADGNGTLQDEANSSQNKLFYTVTTKNNNTFFLIIDKDRTSDNVYMLSMIDESDLQDFIEEEETETADISQSQNLPTTSSGADTPAGLSAEEDLEEPLRKSIGKRLPWLLVLLGLGLVVSSVVGIFEKVVAHLALIVCFQSLVLDMAGNVGTQSLAVTIRVLMDEQVSKKQKLYLISKEARVGLCNGLILGVLSFLFIGLYLYLLKGQVLIMAFAISACTGIALLVAMLLSSIVGTTVPMLFKQLGVDPAVASGPLITTINDLVAVVTYYGLAWVLIINVLQM